MPGGTPSAASDPTSGSRTSKTSRYEPRPDGAVSANCTVAESPGARPAGSTAPPDVPAAAAPVADSGTQLAVTTARDAGISSAIAPRTPALALWPHAWLPRFETVTWIANEPPGVAVAAGATDQAAVLAPVTRTTSAGIRAWVAAS